MTAMYISLGQELGTELGGALAGGGENRFVDRPSHPLGAGSQHGVGIGELLATGIDELDAELDHPVDRAWVMSRPERIAIAKKAARAGSWRK